MTFNIAGWVKGFDPQENKVWAEIEENFGTRRVLPSQLLLLIKAAQSKIEADCFLTAFLDKEPGEHKDEKPKASEPHRFEAIYEISQRYFQGIPGKTVKDYLVFNGHESKRVGRRILFLLDGMEELAFIFFDDTSLVKETPKRKRYANKDIGEFSVKKKLDISQEKSVQEKTDEIRKAWLKPIDPLEEMK